MVAVFSVEQQRHGDGLLDAFARLIRGRRLMTTRRPMPKSIQPAAITNGIEASNAMGSPFSSAAAAQWWREMSRAGKRILLIALIAPFIVLTFEVAARLNSPRAETAFALLIPLVLSPLIYQIIGADASLGIRHKEGLTWYSSFDATRSMANDQLMGIKLLVVAACSVLGCLWMGAIIGLRLSVTEGVQRLEPFQRIVPQLSDMPLYWWLVGLTNLTLFFVSSTSILLAAGLWLPLYPRVFFGLAGVAYAHVGLVVMDLKFDWPLGPLWAAYRWIIPVSVILLSVAVIRRSLESGYLGQRLFACASVLWLVFLTTLATLYWKFAPAIPVTLTPDKIIAALALLLVPLAATALAPLALASHRHA